MSVRCINTHQDLNLLMLHGGPRGDNFLLYDILHFPKPCFLSPFSPSPALMH